MLFLKKNFPCREQSLLAEAIRLRIASAFAKASADKSAGKSAGKFAFVVIRLAPSYLI